MQDTTTSTTTSTNRGNHLAGAWDDGARLATHGLSYVDMLALMCAASTGAALLGAKAQRLGRWWHTGTGKPRQQSLTCEVANHGVEVDN